VLERERRGVGCRIGLARAEEHLDHVGSAGVDVVLAEEEPAPHLQELVDGDPPARVTRRPPRGVVGGRRDVESLLAHQDADRGVEHALRHRPGDVRRRRIEALGVALSHDRAPVDDQHRVRRAEALGLRERVVERAIEEIPVHPAVELRAGPAVRRPGNALRLRRQGGEGMSLGFASQGLSPRLDPRGIAGVV
jgi:hypothetical protein